MTSHVCEARSCALDLRDLSAWEEFRSVADENLELDGERVLVLVSGTARGKSSGVEIGHMHPKAANVFHLRDGKVTRLVIYHDRDRALPDLGLPSEAGSASG